MKKLFTVLAVLLVASVVFAAAFSGEVAAKYTFNFDEKTVSYGKPGLGDVDVTFKWDTGTVTVGGESDTHIDFAASASFEGWYNFGNNHADGYMPWFSYNTNKHAGQEIGYESSEAGTFFFINLFGDDGFEFDGFIGLLKLDVDTFKIVGKTWEVDFLGSVALDYAKSAIDSATFNRYTAEQNSKAYSINNSLKGNHNVAVTAFGGYKFGFGLFTKTLIDKTVDPKYNPESWDNALNFALTAATPEYDFNGVKAQFGAGYQVYDSDWKMAASAKASYAADKWSVGGAYDATLATPADAYITNDLAINFGFAPVSVDVYYANEQASAKDKYYDNFLRLDEGIKVYGENYKFDHEKKLDKNYLSAKVVVDVAKVAENVPVTVTVTGKNLINADKQVLDVAAETTIVPNFKFGVYFKDICDQTNQEDNTKDHRKLGATVEFTGVQNLTLNAEIAYKFAKLDDNKMFQMLVGASYAHELFTASASVAAEKFYDKDVEFAGKAAVVSTTLVEGAELSAKAYFNLNDLQIVDDSRNATNKLVLGCKVAF